MQQAFVGYYNKVHKPSEAPVLFMDAVHPTQSTKLSYGWIRKGQDKLIKTTGSRTRLNLIGAVSLEDIGATVTETHDTINSESISLFLETEERALPTGAEGTPCLRWSSLSPNRIGERCSESTQY